MSLRVTVEAEDEVHRFESAGNGAGPLWCHGSTVVARWQDRVFVAGLETLPDEVPLNNTRWVLFTRADEGGGWELVYRDESGRTREPAPLVLLGDGDLLVSANPTLAASGEARGPAQPTVFRFRADDPGAAPRVEYPVWDGETRFTEHSYRTVSADAERGEVLYMQNEGYEHAQLSLLARGRWAGRGKICWPHGGEYPESQPLRLCYPNVMVRDGGAHFLGVGDIVEPIGEWRTAKKELTGRDWDYVFRRLFYATTPDVAGEPFGDWLELANRDVTAGSTNNSDLWVGPDGTAHLLWVETTTDERLRDRFFPGVEVQRSLEYAAVRDGAVIQRRCLATCGEDEGPVPIVARFHDRGGGRVLILAQFSGEYRMAVLQDGEPVWTDVPFRQPMAGTFLTNTVRGGSAPGPVIDLVGIRPGPALGYARVRIE